MSDVECVMDESDTIVSETTELISDEVDEKYVVPVCVVITVDVAEDMRREELELSNVNVEIKDFVDDKVGETIDEDSVIDDVVSELVVVVYNVGISVGITDKNEVVDLMLSLLSKDPSSEVVDVGLILDMFIVLNVKNTFVVVREIVLLDTVDKDGTKVVDSVVAMTGVPISDDFVVNDIVFGIEECDEDNVKISLSDDDMYDSPEDEMDNKVVELCSCAVVVVDDNVLGVVVGIGETEDEVSLSSVTPIAGSPELFVECRLAVTGCTD